MSKVDELPWMKRDDLTGTIRERYDVMCDEAREACPYKHGDVLKRTGDRAMWLVRDAVACPDGHPWRVQVGVVGRTGKTSYSGLSFSPDTEGLRVFGHYDYEKREVIKI